MKKYECFFEEPRKNVYFKLQPYEHKPNDSVKLSLTAYQGDDNIIEVCLTEKQVDSLIYELMKHKKNFK